MLRIQLTYTVLADERAAVIAEFSDHAVFLLELFWLAFIVAKSIEGDLIMLLDTSCGHMWKGIRAFVVSPKLVPNALRQLPQWQSEVRASSGESSDTLYLTLPQTHFPV
jgi:hypothetical protein